jgi:uncharacterized membrane protein YdbT with pleckstrin-like domain
MSWRDTLLGALHVPPTPAPPPGSPPRVFRAAPNFFKLKLLRWAVTQLGAVIGIIWAVSFFEMLENRGLPSTAIMLLRFGEYLAIAGLVLNAAVGWFLVRLDFELRWYMLSDRAIRIREGITTIREKTIALANIQNIAVQQGPLQRYLGIADVEVRTAGGGGGQTEGGKKGHTGDPMHVAYFRGVANAEQIRDLLREGVRRQRDTGLGDPDEAAHAAAPGDVHEAVAEVLREARALRVAVDRN